MELLPALAGLVLVAAVTLFALVPLVRGASAPSAAAEVQDPERERYELYRQVLELEFDKQTGKLSDADYRLLAGNLLEQAAQSLRENRGELTDLDAQIEREISAARRAFGRAGSRITETSSVA